MEQDTTTPTPKMATQVQAERVIKAELWHLLIKNQKNAGALAVALFYLAGFLTLNAHLSQYGIAEFDIVSTRYLTAAGNFTFFLLCYGLFAGRVVISIHDWITNAGRRVEINGPAGLAGKAIVIARSFTLPVFSICFAAAAYCGTALQQARPDAFYLLLVLAFALTYMLETSKLSSKYPRVSEFIELLIDLAGIAIFFTLGEGEVLKLFWLYFGISIYINYALDLMSRREPGRQMYVYFVSNTVLGVLTLALFFGATLYKKVDQRVGGGKPQSVTLILDDKVREALNLLGGQQAVPLFAKLIYKTDTYLFLDSADRTLQIRAEDVRLMSLERQAGAAAKAASATKR